MAHRSCHGSTVSSIRPQQLLCMSVRQFPCPKGLWWWCSAVKGNKCNNEHRLRTTSSCSRKKRRSTGARLPVAHAHPFERWVLARKGGAPICVEQLLLRRLPSCRIALKLGMAQEQLHGFVSVPAKESGTRCDKRAHLVGMKLGMRVDTTNLELRRSLSLKP